MNVTLTFDNGPHAEGTPYVRSVLKERGIASTFFVVGDRIRDPALLKLAEDCRADGHWIGNHTLTHTMSFGRAGDWADAAREIGEAECLLASMSHPDRLFRPCNQGVLSDTLLSNAAVSFLQEGCYTLVLWNVVAQDWIYPEHWPDRVAAALDALEWALVVLHDTERSAMRRLPLFLDRLDHEGHKILQAFPPECVPIRQGVLVGSLEGLVSS